MRYTNGKGERHRVDRPAVVHADGTREWYLNGELHRVDGPAYERPDGHREWWVEGKLIKSEYTKEK